MKWLPNLPHWLLGQYLAVPSLETFWVFLFDGWFTDYFVVLIILLSQKKNTSRFNYSDFFKCTWLYLFCRRTNWPVKECWDNENKEWLFQIHFYTQRTDTASFYPVTWTCRIYSKAMQYLHRLCITQYCYILYMYCPKKPMLWDLWGCGTEQHLFYTYAFLKSFVLLWLFFLSWYCDLVVP